MFHGYSFQKKKKKNGIKKNRRTCLNINITKCFFFFFFSFRDTYPSAANNTVMVTEFVLSNKTTLSITIQILH